MAVSVVVDHPEDVQVAAGIAERGRRLKELGEFHGGQKKMKRPVGQREIEKTKRRISATNGPPATGGIVFLGSNSSR